MVICKTMHIPEAGHQFDDSAELVVYAVALMFVFSLPGYAGLGVIFVSAVMVFIYAGFGSVYIALAHVAPLAMYVVGMPLVVFGAVAGVDVRAFPSWFRSVCGQNPALSGLSSLSTQLMSSPHAAAGWSMVIQAWELLLGYEELQYAVVFLLEPVCMRVAESSFHRLKAKINGGSASRSFVKRGTSSKQSSSK